MVAKREPPLLILFLNSLRFTSIHIFLMRAETNCQLDYGLNFHDHLFHMLAFSFVFLLEIGKLLLNTLTLLALKTITLLGKPFFVAKSIKVVLKV